ncbi:hypothetical protein, partial [Actinokineospora iranica]
GRNPGKRKVRSGLPLKQMAEAVRAVQDQRGAEVLLRALTPRTPPPITQTIAAGAQAMLDELNNQPTINLGALTANTDQGEQPQAPGETPQESAGSGAEFDQYRFRYERKSGDRWGWEILAELIPRFNELTIRRVWVEWDGGEWQAG